jgi:hypothetical protein
MNRYPIRTWLADLFATEPPAGPHDPARYGKSLGGLVRTLREVVLPDYLEPHPSLTREQNGARREARRALTECFAFLALAAVSVFLLGSRAVAFVFWVGGALSLVSNLLNLHRAYGIFAPRRRAGRGSER